MPNINEKYAGDGPIFLKNFTHVSPNNPFLSSTTDCSAHWLYRAQCDQIELFLKGLNDKFSYKSSPNIGWVWGIILECVSSIYCSKNCSDRQLCGQLLAKVGPLFSGIWSHWTLACSFIWRFKVQIRMTVKFLSFVHPGKTISARFTSTKMTMIDRNGFKSLTNTDSVTRFGKISLLWQYFKGLGQYRDGLLSVW